MGIGMVMEMWKEVNEWMNNWMSDWRSEWGSKCMADWSDGLARVRLRLFVLHGPLHMIKIYLDQIEKNEAGGNNKLQQAFEPDTKWAGNRGSGSARAAIDRSGGSGAWRGKSATTIVYESWPHCRRSLPRALRCLSQSATEWQQRQATDDDCMQ